MSQPVLTVRNLSVSIRGNTTPPKAVDGVSFALRQGEVLAVVGESGCGKTKTAEALMGLLPTDTWDVQADAIELDGAILSVRNEQEMRKIRGREISMIFQEPQTALDPVFTVGNQLCSVYRRHRNKNRTEATLAALDMLQQVGFADPRRILQSYPHQLSGGMRQRVMIAMAMACRPRVLIADEPTTALDVTTQAQVLSRMTLLGREFGTSILLITHDLGVVAQYCDRALVMHGGRIVEKATVHELFTNPQQAYTRRLLAAVPKVRSA
jgi:peptide/nickel transport system ATP-binding protein